MKQLKNLKKTEETEEKEPEEAEEVPEDESTQYKISFKDLNKIIGHDKYANEDKMVNIDKKSLEDFIRTYDFYNQNKYEIKIVDPNERILKVVNKQPILTYDKNQMNKNLMNKETIDVLHFYNLKLPSEYKDKSFEEVQEIYKKSQRISSQLKEKLKNVANYDRISVPGKEIAYPKSKSPKPLTINLIAEHNIMEFNKYNLNLLREFKEKTGQGILLFNNPLQLLDRLELLGGSILAGNNGVM